MNAINKLKEATTTDAVNDSNNQPIFVGDLVAFCPGRFYGKPGYPVYSGIVSEVDHEKKRVRVITNLCGRNLYYGNTCLKISKMLSTEELANNERHVNELKQKAKNKLIEQRHNRITERFILTVYYQNPKNYGFCYIKVCSDKGKQVSTNKIAEAIDDFKNAHPDMKFFHYTWMNTFEEATQTNLSKFRIQCRSKMYLLEGSFYQHADKNLHSAAINTWKKSWYNQKYSNIDNPNDEYHFLRDMFFIRNSSYGNHTELFCPYINKTDLERMSYSFHETINKCQK